MQRIITTLQTSTQILPISNPTGNLQGVNEGFLDKAGETLPMNPSASVLGDLLVRSDVKPAPPKEQSHP